MANSNERLLESVFAREKDQPTTIELLSGGISNENYLVRFGEQQKKPVVVTLYQNPLTWYKIGKEYYIRTLVNNNSAIPLQRLYASGVYPVNDAQVAYLVKEYIEGDTLKSTLEQSETLGLNVADLRELLSDLGDKLAVFHGQPLAQFGDIRDFYIQNADANSQTWATYFRSLLEKRFTFLEGVPPEKSIRGIRARTVQALIPWLRRLAEQQLYALEDVPTPFLTHNDANFLNLLALNSNNRWCISGIIDLEASLAGDPDIDLVAIESQLHLSRYKSLFYRDKKAFNEAYQGKRPVRTGAYLAKRAPYHTSRSLSYFQAIYNPNLGATTERNIDDFFIVKHLEILTELAERGNLDRLDLPPLIES